VLTEPQLQLTRHDDTMTTRTTRTHDDADADDKPGHALFEVVLVNVVRMLDVGRRKERSGRRTNERTNEQFEVRWRLTTNCADHQQSVLKQSNSSSVPFPRSPFVACRLLRADYEQSQWWCGRWLVDLCVDWAVTCLVGSDVACCWVMPCRVPVKVATVICLRRPQGPRH